MRINTYKKRTCIRPFIRPSQRKPMHEKGYRDLQRTRRREYSMLWLGSQTEAGFCRSRNSCPTAPAAPASVPPASTVVVASTAPDTEVARTGHGMRSLRLPAIRQPCRARACSKGKAPHVEAWFPHPSHVCAHV